MNKNIDLLITDIKRLCKENGIKIYLPKSKSIRYENLYISGYFDENTLACAMGKPDSISILIHESCHLDQFLEDKELWNKSAKMPSVDDWLNGKDYSNIEKAIDNLKLIELDCEKRSVQKFIKYNIPFNKKEYIQKANSYVQFYNYLKFSRKWCHRHNTPYSNKNVYSLMPDKFMPISWYDKLPEYALKAFIKEKI